MRLFSLLFILLFSQSIKAQSAHILTVKAISTQNG